jgi:hypothetical protein
MSSCKWNIKLKFFCFNSDISDISCTPPEIYCQQENVMRSFMKNVYSKDKNSKNYTENCLLAYFQGFLAISIMKIQGCCIL